MKRASFALVCAVALAPAASAKPIRPAAPSTGATSRAVTQAILDTIAEEMNRQLTQLEVPGAPRPYHIAYKVTEVDVNDVAATLGHTTSRRNRHFVNIEARVRVGSDPGHPEKRDNANFVVPQAESIDGVAALNLPLEASPRIARRATWLVTDSAYKEALIQLRAKLEARRAGGGNHADVPSFSPAPKVVSDDPVVVPPLESLDEIEARAQAVSAVFRDRPEIRDSRVAITSYLERRWYLTTEGTSVADTRRASGIVIVASGQADDGEPLAQYFLRYGHTAKDLPSDGDLKTESGKLADRIAALAKAPVMDASYRGPVLFAGEGAVGLIRTSLAPHLGGTPVPEGLNPQEAKTFGGQLTDRVGQLVMPRMLSIYDDPTVRVGAGKALIGGYKIDDEGVAAQRVEVVKNGMLKTLLSSRTPSHKGQASNGHARRTAQGGAFHGSATNLFVVGRGGVSRGQLVNKLIAAARARGLKYGLIIDQLDDAAITAAPEFSRRELVQLIKTTDVQLPPPPIVAYRVYPNGKRELVRGVSLGEIGTDAWEDVLAVGKDLTVYNFLAAPESQLELRLTGGTDDGFVPSGGIESAIITPDVLLAKVDVRGAFLTRPTPVVPKPR